MSAPVHVRVSELPRHVDTEVHCCLRVLIKKPKRKKNNEPFLQLQLADVTGQVQANIWNNVAEADKAFEEGHVAGNRWASSVLPELLANYYRTAQTNAGF